MQFNELLILDPCHSTPAPARYREWFIQYRLTILTAPEQIEPVLHDIEDSTRED